MRREAARLRGSGALGFWIHVGADVLDPEVFPAVDTLEPGGLSLSELTELLRELLASGLQVCIYDPDLDPERTHARSIVRVLGEAFSLASAYLTT